MSRLDRTNLIGSIVLIPRLMKRRVTTISAISAAMLL
jgi:hypothetical protein